MLARARHARWFNRGAAPHPRSINLSSTRQRTQRCPLPRGPLRYSHGRCRGCTSLCPPVRGREPSLPRAPSLWRRWPFTRVPRTSFGLHGPTVGPYGNARLSPRDDRTHSLLSAGGRRALRNQLRKLRLSQLIASAAARRALVRDHGRQVSDAATARSEITKPVRASIVNSTCSARGASRRSRDPLRRLREVLDAFGCVPAAASERGWFPSRALLSRLRIPSISDTLTVAHSHHGSATAVLTRSHSSGAANSGP